MKNFREELIQLLAKHKIDNFVSTAELDGHATTVICGNNKDLLLFLTSELHKDATKKLNEHEKEKKSEEEEFEEFEKLMKDFLRSLRG